MTRLSIHLRNSKATAENFDAPYAQVPAASNTKWLFKGQTSTQARAVLGDVLQTWTCPRPLQWNNLPITHTSTHAFEGCILGSEHDDFIPRMS